MISLRLCSAAFAVVLAECSHEIISVDEIIERNTSAMGGATAIEAIHSVAIKLHIIDPTFEVDGVYRAARPGRMRIDVYATGKHVFTEAFNGERAWQWQGKGEPVAENAHATAALRHGVELPGNLFGLHELRGRGHQISFAGREKIDGVNYYVLRTTLSDGYSTSLYIDPVTWLITRRRDVRPLHPDINPKPTTIESVKTDFRKIDGVPFSFHSTDTDLGSGKILETTVINEVAVNQEIPPTVFDKL
jgi:hypothetical protein